ncbi:MAG: non-ribosomal peptide synthase, partial [bacterium]|nr:non-ribosomal peptide synthase [bacterium]
MSPKKNIKNIYALSPMQEGMLFHSLMEEQSTAYVEQTNIRCRGDLNVPNFAEAFKCLIQKYDILRTTFAYKKTKRPLQVVMKDRKTTVHFKDISHLSQQEVDEYMETYTREDRTKGFDLTRDILMRLALFKTGKESWYLVWSFHHILMDGWCIGILIREFIGMYMELQAGRP